MPILKIKNDAGTFVEVPALKGSDGYTPVRGVDYYTEADKNELTAEIIDSISIPTKTSELTNDALFISEGGDISDLSNDVGYLAGTDTTLTQEGKAADAKTVGTQLATKQNIISDLSTIRSGAAAGATAVQTETDPTVPSWAKQTNKPSYEANEITYGDSNIGAAIGDIEEEIGTLNEDLSAKQDTLTDSDKQDITKVGMTSGAAWTDAEQKAARERIGLNGWELISEVTLDEDAGGVYMNTDMAGSPFSLKSCCLYIDCPAVSDNKTLWISGISVAGSYTKSIRMQGALIRTTQNLIFCNLLDNNLPNPYCISFSGGASLTKIPLEPITILQVQLSSNSGNLLPTGLKVKLYGVRA